MKSLAVSCLLIFSLTAAFFGQSPTPPPPSLDTPPAISPPASPVTSSSSPTAQADDAPIKVNTLLLNIPVIASDRNGRNVTNLTKDNFTITQDGEKQPIEFFAGEASPMNVAILIDASGSTFYYLLDIQSAAGEFIKILRPEDRALISCFSNDGYILSEFTADHKKLDKAIGKAYYCPHGASDMQDAVYDLMTERFAKIKGRKAIIVLTDGYVAGRITNERLLYMLAESDVLIYPIVYQINRKPIRADLIPKKKTLPNGVTVTREEFIKRFEEMENQRLGFMKALSTVTGGRFFGSDEGKLKTIFQSIADELKNQYLVGYYPPNSDDGKTHQIAIEVNPKEYVIRTKRRIQLKPSK